MNNTEDEEFEDFPMAYSIDNLILMHRDAHFSGNFALMVDYYQKEGKGISKEFDLPRIQELQALQVQTGKDPALLMLSGPEIEKVAQSKQAYKALRDLYAVKKPKNQHPQLIADLILSEEYEPDAEIKAIVAEKGAIVPALVDVLRNQDFYDPLFPGYGQAPALIAKCLGLIGDKRAIISLFEAIGEGDFFNDDIVLDALRAVGEPAKQFLLKVLHARPLNHDNEQAAVALVGFKKDPEVSTACLHMLKEIDLAKNETLATYLVLCCEGLAEQQRQELSDLARQPKTPKGLRQDILTIFNH
jgi:hypothetical protein